MISMNGKIHVDMYDGIMNCHSVILGHLIKKCGRSSTFLQ